MSEPGQRLIARVLPVSGLDRVLEYLVPEHLKHDLQKGSLVRIPLQRRHALGLVTGVGTDSDYPVSRLKLVIQVLYPHPVFTPDMLQLTPWIQSYYAAGAEAVLETMIPAVVRRGMKYKKEAYLALGRALEGDEFASLERRAPKQARLYDVVRRQMQPQKKSLLLKRLGATPATCKSLVDKGLLQEESRRIDRVAYQDELADLEIAGRATVSLNAEQRSAVDAIHASVADGKFAVHLLHGVTGSGKTEVYIRVLQEVLQSGGGVIYLVPEVALTPQTVGRLRTRLEEESGVRTMVWHSHLSDGERVDAWMALASGEARVVVGARSAVFAPVRNLRLIIVDEEHESAYKQEEVPRYHGRDVAVYRARLNQAVCVLGSATPSLESLFNVSQGKYRLNRLLNRVDDRRLPIFHIVDMRMEQMTGKGSSVLSRTLVDKLKARFEAGEQTILFLNRRGYSSSMLCPDCGFVAECGDCSVSMTYHRADETLKCHLCDHSEAAPGKCPKCGSFKVRRRGLGTQKIEEVVAKILPRAKVVRIDTDTMGRKNTFREILSDFRRGKIHVLIGTQMIAKGLDFPNVTLVAMVDADLSLHIPDFRANERTFQLLVQVAGRAGRGDRAGEVVVQTYTPHAAPIQFSRRVDFEGFLDEELELRKQFHYPPYRRLIHHLFQGINPDKVRFFAEQWAKRAEESLGGLVEIRGPSPCPIEKIRGKYRYQLWYFTTQTARAVRALQDLRKQVPWSDDVIQVLDVDPVSLM